MKPSPLLLKAVSLMLLLTVCACATRETDVPWLENAPKIDEENNPKKPPTP